MLGLHLASKYSYTADPMLPLWIATPSLTSRHPLISRRLLSKYYAKNEPFSVFEIGVPLSGLSLPHLSHFLITVTFRLDVHVNALAGGESH